ncbi:hypothetical protein PCANC_27226 [Puccinia coronata f. sp. avenae]|uniref:NudC domain-containing protein 1 n=1 Tax=Puccinia coronata f. sp. avenae TaxID=200324 RepID=A0A2N5TIH4_9BASI|nr:hypothetical protein PCANC_27226 [Puccinia coronata f. sp. avenae]
MADQIMCFIPSRELLNPRFESYKLKEYEQSNVRRIPLTTAIDLSMNPRFKSFNYHELKSKSTWNHLLVGSFTDTPAQLIWIEPRTLHISTLLQPDSHDPQVAPLLRLPDERAEQLQDHADQGIEFDYPTGFALNYYHLLSSPQDKGQHLWLFLDGGNTLFLVDLNPHSHPRILARKKLSHGFIHAFYKLASVQIKDRQTDTFWIVLRAKSMQPTSQSEQADNDVKKNGSYKKKKLTYTLYVAEMRISPHQNSSTADHPIMPFDLDIQIHARLVGVADVLSVHYDRPGHRWCFRSTSKFTTLAQQTSQSAQPQEQTKGLHDEQQLQAKEERDSKPIVAGSAVNTPYSWSQTLSSLTVVFHIPFSITSKSIQVLLQPKSACFKIPALDSLPQEAEEYLEKLFGYFGQPAFLRNKPDSGGGGGSLALNLWDHIVVEDSTWFVEQVSGNTRGGESRTILTIELEKRSRLRWPQAFQADAQVTETMDPIELLTITENLAKYTSAGNDDDDDDDVVPGGHGHPSKKQKRGLGSAAATNPSALSSTTGAHPLMQPSSLSAGEMDEEIDVANEVMVTGVVLTWLIKKESHAAERPAEAADGTDSEWDVVIAQDGIPVEQISSPLKVVHLDRPPAPQEGGGGTSSWSGEGDGSMMIKADIDGLVFSPPGGGEERKSMRWRHELSFPALAFVMASKREIWASFYTREMCLLFETSSSAPKDRLSLGNLFVYHHTPHRHPLSVQRVVQLSCSNPAHQPSSDSAAPLPLILGLCALQNPNASPSNTPPPLSIVLLAQHEILLFDL